MIDKDSELSECLLGKEDLAWNITIQEGTLRGCEWKKVKEDNDDDKRTSPKRKLPATPLSDYP